MRTSYVFVVGAVSALGVNTICFKATAAEGVADSGEFEGIIVTAQKREKRRQDVPISMTVVNATVLNDLHVETIADLSRTAPSLEITSAFGGPRGGGQIRGIGTLAGAINITTNCT